MCQFALKWTLLLELLFTSLKSVMLNYHINLICFHQFSLMFLFCAPLGGFRRHGKVPTTPVQLTTWSMNLTPFWVTPAWRRASWRMTRSRRRRGQTEEWRMARSWMTVSVCRPRRRPHSRLQETLESLCPRATCSSRLALLLGSPSSCTDSHITI